MKKLHCYRLRSVTLIYPEGRSTSWNVGPLFKQAAAALQPKLSEYLFYIARAYKEMTQREQSLGFADRALELEPKNLKYHQFRTNLIVVLKTPAT